MTCARTWQAAAIEDGRIDALDAASFERHTLQCNECAREAAALRELRESLQRIEPRELSPLEQRRQRAALLRRANELTLTRGEPPHRALVPAAAAVLVALTAIVAVLHWGHSPPPAAQHAAPIFEARAVGGASFRDRTQGPFGRVVLASGSLAVHVEHLRHDQRFVVAVPDGELEVHGTRFIVEVDGGHTQRVLVTEGIVALRLSGAAELRLLAGSSWVRPPPSAAVHDVLGAAQVDDTTAEKATAVVAPRRAATGKGGAPARAVSATRALPAAARTSPAALAPSPSAGDEFSAAMASFRAGAYLDADERFAIFAAHFQTDPRYEDAAFLRAVIATKRGDAAAAVARARDYLKRFPGGLRRVEMQRLLNAPW